MAKRNRREAVPAGGAGPALVEKVRKLLALSESPNEHEAALAAEKAQDLMLRHGMDMAQVALARGATTIGVDEALVNGKIDPWRRHLAHAIADSMGGRVIFARAYRTTAGELWFFGPAGSAQGIAALYRHLESQLVTMSALATASRRERWVHARTYRTSFLLGAVDRLDWRLWRHRLKVTTDASNRALAIIGSAVDDAIEQRFGRLRTERDPSRASFHQAAYSRGEQAGASVDLGAKHVAIRPNALPAGATSHG